MKIVFCGEDSYSAVVLESLIIEKHEILSVFCPIYKNIIYTRLKKTCEKHKINFTRIDNINSERSESLIRKLKPDVISVCHFEKILKKNIIQIPKLGCINLHPSLLPNYRGLSPQHWPIINGDTKTGISVHFINEGIDTGKIILQHEITIDPHMYVSDLQIKMLNVYKFIVKDALTLITQKNHDYILQNHLESSYYGKLKESQCTIKLDEGCTKAYNLIRGVSFPYFGARINNFRIWKASPATKKLNQIIQSKYSTNNIYFNKELGDFIKFDDGSLILEKYNKIN